MANETLKVADRDEEIDDDAEEGQIFLRSDSGEVIRPTSRSSVKKVSSLIAKMNQEKRDIIEEIGFGGLLRLPHLTKVDRGFTFWLLSNVHCESRKILVPGRDEVTMDDAEVQRCLGIPRGKRVVCGLGTDNGCVKLDFIQFCIGAEQEQSNSLLAAKSNVEKRYEDKMSDIEKSRFKVSFVVFVLGYFLAPTTKCNHGSDSFWGALKNPEEIKDYNWCQYVLDSLIDAARKAQADIQAKRKCSNVTGCPLLLQVMFLYNINLGKVHIPYGVRPIVSALSCEFMRKLINAASITTNNYSINGQKPFQNNFAARRTFSDGSVASVNERSQSHVFNAVQNSKIVGLTGFETQPTNFITHSIDAKPKPAITMQSNPLWDFIQNMNNDKISTKQRIALRWMNSRIVLHTNQLKKSIQEDTAELVRRLFPDEKQEKSVTFHGGVEKGTNKRMLHDCTSDAETTSEASSSLHKSVKKYVLPADNHPQAKDDDGIYSPPSNLKTPTHPIKRLLLDTPIISHGSVSNGGDCFKTHVQPITQLSLQTPPPAPNPIGTSYNTPSHPITKHSVVPINQNSRICEGITIPFLKDQVTPQAASSVVSPASPGTVTRLFDESALIARLIDAESAIEHDFTGSPVSMISLVEGNFAKSHWFYGMNHPVRDEIATETIVTAIQDTSSAELSRPWITHRSPRFVQIAGKTIKDFANGESQISYDIIDIAIRRMKQLDEQMSNILNGPRWRHFLESDFSVLSLSGEVVVSSKSVRHQFLGDTVNYNVRCCRMIIVPARPTVTWCCYFWDFQNKVVHVVDPIYQEEESDKLKELHNKTISVLQVSLASCIDAFFVGWNPNFDGWKTSFAVHSQQTETSDISSGVFSLLAARDFNGTKISTLENQVPQYILKKFTSSMIYEILSIKGNCAKLQNNLVIADQE